MLYRGHQCLQRQRRRGAAVVEFAVVAPFIVFATMGMIELTRGIQVKHMLTDAARSGCRLAIQPGFSNSAVTQNVKDVLDENGISSSDATVTIYVNGSSTTQLTAAKQNDQIAVQVSVPVSKVCWITPIFLPGNKVESEKLTMMRQR